MRLSVASPSATSAASIFNQADKDEITALAPSEITNERTWSANITELDRENATGKIRLAGDDESRIPINITDPLFRVQDNPYMRAFTSGSTIALIAKAELSEGDVKRLYVSDVA